MHSVKSIQSILILGATGKTGRHLLHLALAKEYHVTALVREPSKIEITHPNLEILKGDVLNYPDVYNAVQGNDAILSALGRDGKEVSVLTKGTSHILRAMGQSSIQKFVCLSSLGAGSTRKLAGWKLKWMIRLFGLKNSFEAKAEQELLLFQSVADFSLVMSGPLSDAPATGICFPLLAQDVPCYNGMPPAITREDVARFMVDQLETDSWRRKTVCLLGKI